MNKTRELFKNYLKDTKLLSIEQLGDGKSLPTITDAQNAFLEKNLRNQAKSNGTIVMIAVAMLCIIFLTGIFFVFYYRDDPQAIGLIFGGTFLSLMAIVTKLRNLWLEKNMLDVSINILDDLPPEEAAKFVQTIYFKMLNPKKEK